MHELIDCRAVEQRIHQFLDGELTEGEADELRHHLDVCEHCLDETDMIDALKRLVRRACACPPAPDTLRLRIVTQIHTVSWTRVEYRAP